MQSEGTSGSRAWKRLGACYRGGAKTSFTVWAPKATHVEVHIVAPGDRTEPLQAVDSGYFYGEIDNVEPGTLYKFRLDKTNEFPDPASRWQPLGVHGPSSVAALKFAWTDERWTGVPLRDYIIYELHVGTFTPQGTFDGIIERLDYLKELVVTAVELRPVTQFPGSRNLGL